MARRVGTLMPARSATSAMLSFRRKRARRMFSPIAASAFRALGGTAVCFFPITETNIAYNAINSNICFCYVYFLRPLIVSGALGRSIALLMVVNMLQD